MLPSPLLLLGSLDSTGIPALTPQPLYLPSFPLSLPRIFLLLPLFVSRGGCSEVEEGVGDLRRALLQPQNKNQVHRIWFLVFKIIYRFSTSSTSFTLKPQKNQVHGIQHLVHRVPWWKFHWSGDQDSHLSSNQTLLLEFWEEAVLGSHPYNKLAKLRSFYIAPE